jgi:hypothetical protein
MAIRSIQRRKTILGYASPDEAPIYVNNTDNSLRLIPAGKGTTRAYINTNGSTTWTAINTVG